MKKYQKAILQTLSDKKVYICAPGTEACSSTDPNGHKFVKLTNVGVVAEGKPIAEGDTSKDRVLDAYLENLEEYTMDASVVYFRALPRLVKIGSWYYVHSRLSIT